MKVRIQAVIAFVALALPLKSAAAADLRAPDRIMKAPATAVFDWSGFYLGTHLGYGWGRNHWQEATPGDPTRLDWNSDGIFGGVHGSYNVQFGSWLAGLQGEINASSVDGSRGLGPFPVVARSQNSKLEWFGSLDARLGVVAGTSLFYLIGGYAFAEIEHGARWGTARFSFSATHHGWNIGGGIEHALPNSWTARIEYRYYDFGSESFPARNIGLFDIFPHDYELKMHAVRGALSYRFATGKAPAAVMTRY